MTKYQRPGALNRRNSPLTALEAGVQDPGAGRVGIPLWSGGPSGAGGRHPTPPPRTCDVFFVPISRERVREVWCLFLWGRGSRHVRVPHLYDLTQPSLLPSRPYSQIQAYWDLGLKHRNLGGTKFSPQQLLSRDLRITPENFQVPSHKSCSTHSLALETWYLVGKTRLNHLK